VNETFNIVINNLDPNSRISGLVVILLKVNFYFRKDKSKQFSEIFPLETFTSSSSNLYTFQSMSGEYKILIHNDNEHFFE
jgi:hypothetical protein